MSAIVQKTTIQASIHDDQGRTSRTFPEDLDEDEALTVEDNDLELDNENTSNEIQTQNSPSTTRGVSL